MIGIVVTGHGLFAEGIQSSAVMIAGVNENARYVCFKEGMGTEELAADLLTGRRERKENLRDELLHTVACKAAIKAGWHTDERELQVLVKQVMEHDDLKYCPHGRPICITLSKKQLEKQFKRT